MLPCLNKKLFGLDCPGCGLQRAVVMVCKGEFTEAFNLFPAIYTTLLFCSVIIIHFFLQKKLTSRISIGLAIINVIVMLSAYLIKMNNFIFNI